MKIAHDDVQYKIPHRIEGKRRPSRSSGERVTGCLGAIARGTNREKARNSK